MQFCLISLYVLPFIATFRIATMKVFKLKDFAALSSPPYSIQLKVFSLIVSRLPLAARASSHNLVVTF